jgi:hypothetical protein
LTLLKKTFAWPVAYKYKFRSTHWNCLHCWTKKIHKGVSRKINSGDKIDNINQDSDIEKGGDSSEELDDDTVHQNVQLVNSIKS